MEKTGDYHDFYLKKDVLLLTDVFEKSIGVCWEYYRLDPCHYFSSPRLSWNALIKITRAELELISDIDMYLFVENGMREDIYYVVNRYSKANNKYMNSYDDRKPSKYITYLDVNNLHGWVKGDYLRFSRFN